MQVTVCQIIKTVSLSLEEDRNTKKVQAKAVFSAKKTQNFSAFSDVLLAIPVFLLCGDQGFR